jgi:hypothetical protein
MDGEGGYRPSAAETEVTKPTQKLEKNFVDGYADLLRRNPDYPSNPDYPTRPGAYIRNYITGFTQPYGAVAPKDGKTALSGSEAVNPQNYVFRFGAGVLRQGDLAMLGVPFAQKGREALILKTLQRNTTGKSEPGDNLNMAEFTWGIDNGVVLRVLISGRHQNVDYPITVENCVAEVPLVHPVAPEGQSVPPGLTGEDLINSAVQKSKAAKT